MSLRRTRYLLATVALLVGLLPVPALGLGVDAVAHSAAAVADRAAESGTDENRMPGPHRSYPVWRGGHASLPEHTIFRPADVRKVPYQMPIVVWANGGCRDSNEEYRYFLTTFASYGVFIVANGAPENPFVAADLTGVVSPQPDDLITGIDWALAQNSNRKSPYFQRLDAGRVLVMGQSCGGWEATDASSDARVTSTIIWNSGANPRNMSGMADLHAPVLFAYGGVTDHVAWDAIASYQLAEVPAVLASGSEGGHTNWWDAPPEGTPPPSDQQKEPLPVAANWLAFTLYGSSDGRHYFLGEDCGLCMQPGWTVESKNW